MLNNTKSIMIIDDDSLVANSLARMLRRKNYDVSVCPDPKSALVFCERMKFDLIITDQRMPVMNGTEFAALAKPTQPDARVVLISGYSDSAKVIEAFNSKTIHQHVCKPWDNDELLSVVEDQLKIGEEKHEEKHESGALMVNFRPYSSAMNA